MEREEGLTFIREKQREREREILESPPVEFTLEEEEEIKEERWRRELEEELFGLSDHEEEDWDRIRF